MTDAPAFIEPRGQQLFPVFTGPEILRLRRFGIIRDFGAGTTVATADDPANGLLFILSGTVAITIRGVSGDTQQIATYGPGACVAELADLFRARSSVTASALDPLSVLLVSTASFAEMTTAEADLSDRILRSLILRLVGLTEAGDIGLIIVGSRSSQDVSRIESHLASTGHAPRNLDPDIDRAARSLIQRLRIASTILPIVLCPNGRLLRNPTDPELSSAIGPSQPTDEGAIQ